MSIINFTTICFKLNALGNIVHSILHYNDFLPVSNLRLPKEWKIQAKSANSKKSWAKKVSKTQKIELFSKKFSIFNFFLNSKEINLFF